MNTIVTLTANFSTGTPLSLRSAASRSDPSTDGSSGATLPTALRLAQSGELVEPQPMGIAPSGNAPSAAADGPSSLRSESQIADLTSQI